MVGSPRSADETTLDGTWFHLPLGREGKQGGRAGEREGSFDEVSSSPLLAGSSLRRERVSRETDPYPRLICFLRWGFRKCEEIVWVKTNKMREGGPGVSFDFFLSDASSLETRSDDPSFLPQIDPPTDSIFQNTKEHCLMGIRGTVRRATDGWFVHTNVSLVRLLNPRRDRFLLTSAIII